MPPPVRRRNRPPSLRPALQGMRWPPRTLPITRWATLLYAIEALGCAGIPAEALIEAELDKLPDHLREQVELGVRDRLTQWKHPDRKNRD